MKNLIRNSIQRANQNLVPECQICPAPGQVCDPITGDCVCPPNTVGEICENCTTNAWDYDPLRGCTLCECSDIGADGPDCSPVNGQVIPITHRIIVL